MPGGGGWERSDDDDVTASGASAIRPFLGRPQPGPIAAAVPFSTDEGSGAVRPYYLTRGRVASADERVQVETVVVAIPARAHRLPVQAWEHQRLMALAAEPTSVVELSVAMGVPVGVALVLVGDLARDGLLELSTPAVAPRDDVELIRRLIDGVCAL